MFEVKVTYDNGENRVSQNRGRFDGSVERLVSVLAKEHRLNQYQRAQLLTKRIVKVPTREGNIYIEILHRRRAAAPGPNSMEGAKPFLIQLIDGSQFDWFKLTDAQRAGYAESHPAFYAGVMERLREVEAAERAAGVSDGNG